MGRKRRMTRSWVDDTISDMESHLDKLRSESTVSGEERKLMDELRVLEIYIGTVKSKKKKAKAIKRHEKVLKELKTIRSS